MEKVIVKTVGHGTAASNIGPLGNTLHVIVHNWHSMYDGPINVSLDVVEATGPDADGRVSSDKIQTTETIHATWMPSGSNRLTAPNIRVGERVEILQEADTDRYYWRPMGLDEDLRRLETIIWGISATPNEGDDPTDPENRYWIEFSSHSKKIVLTTSDKNGEATRYSVSMDLEEAIVNLMDTRGNYGTLTTLEDNWKFGTRQGSYLELDKVDINLNAVRDLDVSVGNNLNVQVGNNATFQIANLLRLLATQIEAEGSTGINLKGGGATINLSGNTITWSASSFVGN